ncbi:hypothetical protein AB1Y20_013235 [Prymnesium parvum]|uniref:Protein RFT1 homolog n=1 Tax=Prymnesium parvum TaxID=97485 RepID=A0AB34IKM8_PRYPA
METQSHELDATMRTMFMIVSMQLLGYASKAQGLLGDNAEAGLAGFVYNVALPATLFKSVAQLALDQMAIQIVVGVVLAKIILVLFARALALAITRRGDTTGAADTLGGLIALMVSMSDDVGLGVPLFGAFFPENRHAVAHLFVLSALQSILINPLGPFLMLGIGQAKASTSTGTASTKDILLKVLWALKSNPPVIAAVAGVVFNLSQRIIGSTVDGRPQLPWYISVVVSMAGQAFTPLVLFIAGLGTRGSIGSLGSLRGVILPTALVVFKSLILPVVAYGCVFLLGGNEEARDYAFAYGLLPVANAIFAISRSYGIDAALMTQVAASLFLGKVTSFVLLLLLAAVFQYGFASSQMQWACVVLSNGMHMVSLGSALIFLLRCISSPSLRHVSMHRIVTLVVIQAGQSSGFLVRSLLSILPIHYNSQAGIMFCIVSSLRWAAIAYISILAVDQARAAKWFALQLDTGADILSSSWLEECPKVPEGAHLKIALLFGLAMTIPWVAPVRAVVLGAELADVQHRIQVTDPLDGALWAPYGGSQALLYAIVYFLLGLIIALALGVVLHRGRGESYRPSTQPSRPSSLTMTDSSLFTSRCLPPSRSNSEFKHLGARVVTTPEAKKKAIPVSISLPELPVVGAGLDTPSQIAASNSFIQPRYLGISFRVQLLCLLALLRCICNCVTSLSIATLDLTADTNPTLKGLHVTLSLLLYIFIFLEDGQGMLTVMFFAGLDEKIFQVYLSVNDYIAWLSLENSEAVKSTCTNGIPERDDARSVVPSHNVRARVRRRLNSLAMESLL